MNVLIINQSLARKAFAHVFAVKVHLARELIEARVGHIFDRAFYAKRLQRFAQVIKLLSLLQSNFFTCKTAIRQEGNVAFLYQASERFAHRRSAYTEPL